MCFERTKFRKFGKGDKRNCKDLKEKKRLQKSISDEQKLESIEQKVAKRVLEIRIRIAIQYKKYIAENSKNSSQVDKEPEF